MMKIFKLFVYISIILFSACSQSGRRHTNTMLNTIEDSNVSTKEWSGKTVIKMIKKDGVNYVPVEINGSKMFFVFDTGAGMVSISSTEVLFLYKQGTLTDDDVLGIANFIDANGDISEGTIINLKTVKIGDRTLENVRASVVHNMNAPLLLGQSALESFGKISINNNKNEIIFE